MIVNLVKIKKYLIYFFLFLIFNCFFTLPVKADDISFVREYNVSTTSENFLRGITFNNNGTKMYTTAISNPDRIDEFDLDTNNPYNITTSYVTASSSLAQSDNDKILNPYSLRFGDNGSKIFFLKNTSKILVELYLDTPYDISSDDSSKSKEYELLNNSRGIIFNADGSKLFVANSTGGEIDVYTLSTP